MLKIFHTNLDSVNPIDGVIRSRYIPRLGVSSLVEADVIFFWFTWQKGFEFDVHLFNRIKELKKPVVVCDFTEVGEMADSMPYYGYLSESSYSFGRVVELDAIKDLPIVLYFKRELYEDEVIPEGYEVLPIDYMAYDTNIDNGIVPFNKFQQREIKLFNCWGLSNFVRPKVHAQLIEIMNHGYNVCDNMDYVTKEKFDIITLYRPHHTRMDMDTVYTIQKNSKMSLSLQGCGKKCFRHSEANKNSVMVHTDTKMVWAFPWDRRNSIIIPKEPSLEDFKELLSIPDEQLYKIYLEGVMNHRNYLPENYIPYIWQNVINRIKG